MNGKKTVKVAVDLLYTILATVVMNVVLQLIVYPLTTKFYGESVTGEILYFIGFIYIIPQALGTTLSNTRLVVRKAHEATNGDFTHVILFFSVLSALACGFIGFAEHSDAVFAVCYGLFSVLYLLRAYAQVEFRLKLKFKEYFIYYCIISIGYLIGFALFTVTRIWLLIFVVGEAFALLYSFVRGTIFNRERRQLALSTVNKTIGMIAVSTLVRDCVIQFDKVILKQTINAEVVTQYHVISLLAKTMQMLIQPINTLIMSYLTVKDAHLSKKDFKKFILVAVVVGIGFYGICLIGTPIYVKLFYPGMGDAVLRYNAIVNSGLILGFLAAMFMSVMLSQGQTRLHMLIECVWGGVYIAAAYWFSARYAIAGLAYVTLVMNAIKTLLAAACVYFSLKPKQEETPTA